mgnify:CR=1 FL=1
MWEGRDEGTDNMEAYDAQTRVLNSTVASRVDAALQLCQARRVGGPANRPLSRLAIASMSAQRQYITKFRTNPPWSVPAAPSTHAGCVLLGGDIAPCLRDRLMEWLSGLAKSAQKRAYHYVLVKSLGWALLKPLQLESISVESGVGSVSDLRFDAAKLQAVVPGAPMKLISVVLKRVAVSKSFHITADGISVVVQMLPGSSATPSQPSKQDATWSQTDTERGLAQKEASGNSSIVQRAIDKAMGSIQLTLSNVTVQVRGGAASGGAHLTAVLPHLHLAAPSVKRRMHTFGIDMHGQGQSAATDQMAAFLQTRWRLRAEGGAQVTVRGGPGAPELPLATLGQTGQPIDLEVSQTLSQQGLGCRLDAFVDLPPLRVECCSTQVQLLHGLLCSKAQPAQQLQATSYLSDSASSFVSASDGEGGGSPTSASSPRLGAAAETGSDRSSDRGSDRSSDQGSVAEVSPHTSEQTSSPSSERGSVCVFDTHAALQMDLAQLGGALAASGALSGLAASLSGDDNEATWLHGGSMLDSFATARGGGSMLASAVLDGGGREASPGSLGSGFLATLPEVQVQADMQREPPRNLLIGDSAGGSSGTPPWGSPRGSAPPAGAGSMAQSWRAVQTQLQRSGFWAVDQSPSAQAADAPSSAAAPAAAARGAPAAPAAAARGAPAAPAAAVNRPGRATSRAADEATAAAHSFLSSLDSVQVRKSSSASGSAWPAPPSHAMGQSFSPDYLPAPQTDQSSTSNADVHAAFAASASLAASDANLEPFYASSAAAASQAEAVASAAAADTMQQTDTPVQVFLPGFFFHINVMALQVQAVVQRGQGGNSPPPLQLQAHFVSLRGVLPETAATGSTATLDVNVGSVQLMQGSHKLLHSAPGEDAPAGQPALRASVAPRLLGYTAAGKERWGTLVGAVLQHDISVQGSVAELVAAADVVLALVRCWPLPPATVQSVLEPSVKWSVEALRQIYAAVNYEASSACVQLYAECAGMRACGGTSRAVVVALACDALQLRLGAPGAQPAVQLEITGEHTDEEHQEGIVPTDSLFCLRAKAPGSALGAAGVELDYSWLLQPGSTNLRLHAQATKALLPLLTELAQRFVLQQPFGARGVIRPPRLPPLPPSQPGARSCTSMRLALHTICITANMQRCSVELRADHTHVQAAAAVPEAATAAAGAAQAPPMHTSTGSSATGSGTGRFADRPQAPRLSRAKSEAVRQAWRLSSGSVALLVDGQPLLLGGGGASGLHSTAMLAPAALEPCLRLQLGSFAMQHTVPAAGSHTALQLHDWCLLQPGTWARRMAVVAEDAQQLFRAVQQSGISHIASPRVGVSREARPKCTVVTVSASALRLALQREGRLGGATLDVQSLSGEIITPLDCVDAGGMWAGQVKLLQAGLWQERHCAAPLLPRALAALQGRQGNQQLWQHVPVCVVAQLAGGELGVVWGVPDDPAGPAAASTSVLVSAPRVLIAGLPANISDTVEHLSGPWETQICIQSVGAPPGLSVLKGGAVRSLWHGGDTVTRPPPRQHGFMQIKEAQSNNASRDLSSAPAVSTVVDYFGASAAPAEGGGEQRTGGRGLRKAAVQANYFGTPSAAPASSGHSHHVSVLGAAGSLAPRLPLHLLASVHTAGQPVSAAALALAQPVVSRALRYGVLPATAMRWSGRMQQAQLRLEPPPLCALGSSAAAAPPPPDLSGALHRAAAPARQLLLGHVMRGEGAFSAGGEDVHVLASHALHVVVTRATMHVYLSASEKDAAAVRWEEPTLSTIVPSSENDASTVGGAPASHASAGGVGATSMAGASIADGAAAVSPPQLQRCRQGLLLSLPQLGASFLSTQLADADGGVPVVQQMTAAAHAPHGAAIFTLTAALGQLTAVALGLGGGGGSQHSLRLVSAVLATPTDQPVLTEFESPTVSFARVLPAARSAAVVAGGGACVGASLNKAADAVTAHQLQSAAHSRDMLHVCVPQVALVLDPESWAHITQLREGWAGESQAPAAAAPVSKGRDGQGGETRPALSMELVRGTRATLYVPVRLGPGAGAASAGEEPAGEEGGAAPHPAPLVGAGLREGDRGISTLLPEFKWDTHVGVGGASLDKHAAPRRGSGGGHGGTWSNHAPPPPAPVHASSMHVAAAAGAAAAEWGLRQFGKAAAATDALRRHAAAAVGAMGPHVAAVGSVGTVIWKALQGAVSGSRE